MIFGNICSFSPSGVSTISVATVILAEYLIVGWALEGKATFLGAAVAVVGFAVWNLGAFKAAVARVRRPQTVPGNSPKYGPPRKIL